MPQFIDPLQIPVGSQLDRAVDHFVFFIGISEGIPRYSTDAQAAYEMEEKLASLGEPVQQSYVRCLTSLVCDDIEDTMIARFNLVHASPEKRCRAALMTMLEHHDGLDRQ